jgi:hypothetical protein
VGGRKEEPGGKIVAKKGSGPSGFRQFFFKNGDVKNNEKIRDKGKIVSAGY